MERGNSEDLTLMVEHILRKILWQISTHFKYKEKLEEFEACGTMRVHWFPEKKKDKL